MSIEKKFLKSKPLCKVKFSLGGDSFTGASSVVVVGDFNDWKIGETPMKKAKDGNWSCSVDLETGKTYQFRYLIDGNHWMNDHESDGLVTGGLGSENTLLNL